MWAYPLTFSWIPSLGASLDVETGPTTVDQDYLDTLIDEFQNDLLPRFTGFKPTREQWTQTAVGLLQNSSYRFCSNFHQATLPMKGPLGWTLNANIKEGARVCAEAEIDQGTLSVPKPIGLQGFSVLGGSIVPNQIHTDNNGTVKIFTGYLVDVGLTEQIKKSPLKAIFPDGKVAAIALKKLLNIEIPQVPSDPNGPMSIMKGALNLVGLHGGICTEETTFGMCLGPEASLAVYLNFPDLLKTIQEQKFLKFDFSGILNESFLDWPAFPLSRLPLPKGVELTGQVDLHWDYQADTKVTTIRLDRLDARIRMPEWLGQEAIHLTGGLTLTLTHPGKVQVEFHDFGFHVPHFPSKKKSLGTFSGKLDGTVKGEVDLTAGHFKLSRATLGINDLSFLANAGQGIRPGNGEFTVTPQIKKSSLQLDYQPEKPGEALRMNWNLKGEVPIQLRTMALDLKEFQFSGKTLVTAFGGQFRPALDQTEVDLKTTIQLPGFSPNSLTLKGLHVALKGTNTRTEGESTVREADMRVGLGALQLGDSQIKPAGPLATLHLVSTRKKDAFKLSGAGDLHIRVEEPKVAIGASLQLGANFSRKDYRWLVDFDRPSQNIGPITATRGRLRIFNTRHNSLRAAINRIRLTTERDSYDLDLNGDRVASGVKLFGWLAMPKSSLIARVMIRNLMNVAKVQVGVVRGKRNNRLFGDYKVEPRQAFEMNGVRVTRATVKGRYGTPELSKILHQATWVKGNANLGLAGEVHGDLAATYHLWLRPLLAEKALRVAVDRNQPHASQITFGPIVHTNAAGGREVVEGSAILQGALRLALGDRGVRVTGWKPGIYDGLAYVKRLKPEEKYARGPTPALYDVMFGFDRLCGIRKGLAYACRSGKGLLIEGTVDPQALGLSVKEHDRDYKITIRGDRVFYSPEGYWRALKRFVEKLPEEAKGG